MGQLQGFLWLIRWIHWFWQNFSRLSTTKECGHSRAPSGTYRRGVCAPSRANYQISIWAVRLGLYQVVSAHLQKKSKNSKKYCFLQPQHCVLCPQYVPTEYVHSETDGLMLLEIILKVSAALPVHCGQLLMDNIGSTTQMWGWGAMGNTHPRAWIYRL